MYGKLSHDSFGTDLFLLSTDEYLPHTVLGCKLIDPQSTTFSYVFEMGEKILGKSKDFE